MLRCKSDTGSITLADLNQRFESGLSQILNVPAASAFRAEMESALADRESLTAPFLPLRPQTCKDSLEDHSHRTPPTS